MTSAAALIVVCALAGAGCGSTSGVRTTTTTATASVTATVSASATTATVAAPPVSAVPRIPVGKLSHRQALAYRRACGYFAGDLQALTGELKMSNLTGQEVTEAARYVVQDFTAWEPTLTGTALSQLTRAATILAQQETQAGSGSVSSQAVSTLETTLHAPPFTSLDRTVAVICRHAPK